MLVDERESWQDKFASFRNDHLEHRRPLPPAFIAAFYSLDQAELAFANTWGAMEDIATRLLATKLPSALVLREIPADERDPTMPKRFGFALVRPDAPS
jgi:hypothetical protein